MVDELQGRIAELTMELGQQGPELAAAKQEMTRLQGVEADLSRTIQTLHSEFATLNKTHLDELAAVITVGDELRAERDAAVAEREAMRAERDDAFSVRDSIRKDRDEHIANFEELEKRRHEETTRLRRRAKGLCDTLTEMDTLLGGECFLPPSAFSDCFLLLCSYSYFPS
jgi:predicted  nucleic acid-binding Zn-ribbon protein